MEIQHTAFKSDQGLNTKLTTAIEREAAFILIEASNLYSDMFSYGLFNWIEWMNWPSSIYNVLFVSPKAQLERVKTHQRNSVRMHMLSCICHLNLNTKYRDGGYTIKRLVFLDFSSSPFECPHSYIYIYSYILCISYIFF